MTLDEAVKAVMCTASSLRASAEWPASSRVQSSQILLEAWKRQVLAEWNAHAAVPKRQRVCALARALCAADGSDPDVLVPWTAQDVMLATSRRGNLACVSSLTVEARPLWVHYLGLAQAAIDAEATQAVA